MSESSSTSYDSSNSEYTSGSSSNFTSSTTTKNSTYYTSDIDSESNGTSSSNISTTLTPYIYKSDNKHTKNPTLKFIIFLIISIILIILINIIIIIIFIKFKKKNIEEYRYQLVYYDLLNNSTVMKGEIKKIEKIRGFQFSDANGVGYVYPLTFDDGKESEFKIEGKCSCCVECENNENCQDGKVKFCQDNVCVGCRDTDDCEDGLVCNRGSCVNGYCSENEECQGNEMCDNQGNCIVGCRNDQMCGSREICNDWKGECYKGCRMDDDCKKKGQVCKYGECANGCSDNNECGGYENVCIDYECVNAENANSCVSDDECESGTHCNYEYLICVDLKNRRTTSVIESKRRVLTGVCTLYGMITLFVMAASYLVVSNNAENLLTDECLYRCAQKSRKRERWMIREKVKIQDVDISDTKRGNERKKRFLCRGFCKGSSKKYVKLNRKHNEYAQDFCPKQFVEKHVTITQSVGVFTDTPKKAFGVLLNEWCERFEHFDVMRYPNTVDPCMGDRKTIECEKVAMKGT